MVSDNLITVILAAIGTGLGLLNLGLHILKYRKERPIVGIFLTTSSYSIDSEKKRVLIKARFFVNNKGNKSTSIIFSQCYIHITPERAILSEIDPTLPTITIEPNTTKSIEYNYELELNGTNTNLFVRCARAFNFLKGYHYKRNDLPLAVHFIFKETHGGELKEKGCVFREDQEESKQPYGEVKGLVFSELELSLDDKKSRPEVT